jgi:hypothetical protein
MQALVDMEVASTNQAGSVPEDRLIWARIWQVNIEPSEPKRFHYYRRLEP